MTPTQLHISTPQPMRLRKLLLHAVLLLLVTAAVLLACSLVGPVRLKIESTPCFWQWSLWQSQIWQIRLYRLIAAAAVGVALAIGGAALQGLLRNPLAEPYILGISSGAGVGVLLGMHFAALIALSEFAATPVLALIGALATTVIVYTVAQRQGRLDPLVLLLSGVMINVFNGALVMLILQFVKQTDMIHYIGWGMGQIPEYFWERPGWLLFAWLLIGSGWLCLILRGTALNALGLGDEVAASTGVNVHRLRLEIFIVVSLITSAAVGLAGPVGFVGLIVPHVTRLVLGPDHRRLIITAGFFGAIFLMLADTSCRLIGGLSDWGELPVGVVTAIVGGPFFIILLRKRMGGQRP